MAHAIKASRKRLDQLETHLREENPILLTAVREFRALDRIAHRMRLLRPEESFANKVPWWPIVSVLGTFSAGKSTFVNGFLGFPLQRTGNQAVDDKFTVIVHSADREPRVLPGTALDADPRLPFFRIGAAIEQAAPGEGNRIDAYLQLKTCPSEELRGKILIDSPGFDADDQRTSILRLTEHIIDLSDLVLLFFDGRHPEPGAMRDTLGHLVASTRGRADPNKFLFILNQIDTTARENNLEEVYASWQRALASSQLTSGRFYCIYDRDASVQIDDEEVRARIDSRRDADHTEIASRIDGVGVSRAYRIVDVLENTCQSLPDRMIPQLTEALARWRRLVLVFDAVLIGLIVIGVLFLAANGGFTYWWEQYQAFPGTDFGLGTVGIGIVKAAVILGVLWFVHTRLRRLATGIVRGRLEAEPIDQAVPLELGRAFLWSTRLWRPLWATRRPAGWSRRAEQEVHRILEGTTELVQKLNDEFARPAGQQQPQSQPAGVAETTPG